MRELVDEMWALELERLRTEPTEALIRQLIGELYRLYTTPPDYDNAHMRGHRDRVKKYAQLRASGLGRHKAASQLGIATRTTYKYDAEIKQGQG